MTMSVPENISGSGGKEEESEDESEILEESPCGRWQKRREQVRLRANGHMKHRCHFHVQTRTGRDVIVYLTAIKVLKGLCKCKHMVFVGVFAINPSRWFLCTWRVYSDLQQLNTGEHPKNHP